MFIQLLAASHEQFLTQITHKSKPGNNAGFTKWLEILAAENFHRNSSGAVAWLQRSVLKIPTMK